MWYATRGLRFCATNQTNDIVIAVLWQKKCGLQPTQKLHKICPSNAFTKKTNKTVYRSQKKKKCVFHFLFLWLLRVSLNLTSAFIEKKIMIRVGIRSWIAAGIINIVFGPLCNLLGITLWLLASFEKHIPLLACVRTIEERLRMIPSCSETAVRYTLKYVKQLN